MGNTTIKEEVYRLGKQIEMEFANDDGSIKRKPGTVTKYNSIHSCQVSRLAQNRLSPRVLPTSSLELQRFHGGPRKTQ